MRTGVVIVIILLVLILVAILVYRSFVRQVPCGDDQLQLQQLNGSFEDGNFQPGPDGSMNLGDASTDLAPWAVRVNRASANPLRWSDKRTGILQTDFGFRFVNLAGFGNPPREPYPAVALEAISVQPGRYELGLALGQDREKGFPGPVSADVRISGVATLGATRTTDGNGANWQAFSVDFDVNHAGTIAVTFGATAGQGAHFVRYIGLDGVSLRQFVPIFRCPPR